MTGVQLRNATCSDTPFAFDCAADISAKVREKMVSKAFHTLSGVHGVCSTVPPRECLPAIIVGVTNRDAECCEQHPVTVDMFMRCSCCLCVPVPATLQQALGLGSRSGSAAGAAAGTIPVGDPTAADSAWGLAKKRMAVAADNQEATNITSYAKPDFVKQLIRECDAGMEALP